MATETIVPAASAAAPSSAPASSPAPSAQPPAAPVVPAVPAATSPAASVAAEAAKPAIDPSKLSTYDYAEALVKEKLGAKAADEQPTADAATAATATEVQPAAEVPATETAPAPDAEKPAEAKAEEPATEEDFQLEPEAPVTPEALSQMVKDNPDFGKLLDADPKLKGQLYKTAREAAELKPYREIFPDVDSAKAAQDGASTWNDVRNTFLGAATKDGTVATLGKMAELCYEHNENGEVVTDAEGDPVIGEDFYGFVDNVVGLDLDHRSAEVDARLKANAYGSQEERDRDESVKAALDILRQNDVDAPAEELPAALQRRAEEIERREREAQQRTQQSQAQERKSFERGLIQEANTRIGNSISGILANVEKQGAVVSPYLKTVLPQQISGKLLKKIQGDVSLQSQMQELQRLPVGESAKQRRVAAIDRAVQRYLPEVAREELREAGVQVKASADAKRAKEQAQAETTQKTEPKGSTGPAGRGSATLGANAAFDTAKSEWQKANPGKVFDKVAKEMILPRVLQLMTAQ